MVLINTDSCNKVTFHTLIYFIESLVCYDLVRGLQCPVLLKPSGDMCQRMTPHPAIYILRQEHPLTRTPEPSSSPRAGLNTVVVKKHIRMFWGCIYIKIIYNNTLFIMYCRNKMGIIISVEFITIEATWEISGMLLLPLWIKSHFSRTTIPHEKEESHQLKGAPRICYEKGCILLTGGYTKRGLQGNKRTQDPEESQQLKGKLATGKQPSLLSCSCCRPQLQLCQNLQHCKKKQAVSLYATNLVVWLEGKRRLFSTYNREGNPVTLWGFFLLTQSGNVVPQDLWKPLQEYSGQTGMRWMVVEVDTQGVFSIKNQVLKSRALNIFNGHSEALYHEMLCAVNRKIQDQSEHING
ncbi:hypothetical protein VP01_158g5 [Puccinia sorghi]|uniref:Uncharacterized protein n=1 Tax=Puccinia sorghi TaxID=27349 RepID=A0A0L6VHI4_9BASI|nr:hypothetical protein VP01_158g5 [Puccinia sorghi]